MPGGRQRLETVGGLLQEAAEVGDPCSWTFSGRSSPGAGPWSGPRRGALAALGVRAGDRVATFLDNSLDAVLVWLGANLLGAVDVPVNIAYRGEFLRHQRADSGAAVVVTEADLAGRVAGVAAGLPDLRHLVVRDPAPDGPAVPGVSVHGLADVKGAGVPVNLPVTPSTWDRQASGIVVARR